jgi:RNA polymerase sigma-70 factor (ECF subfamily)
MSDMETSAHRPAPADVFAVERPRLLGLAYRLLGSMADAEDVVQDAWLRFDRTDPASIERPAAWLTTVVSRLGLDRLRARQRDRADYVGPWLPEPIGEPSTAAGAASDPAEHAALADSLTTAFLVLLETLTPTERLALLLADVFAEPFVDVAAVLDKSEAATRQLTSRARRKLRDADPALADRRPVPMDEQQRIATELVVAVASGDIERAARLLAPDVILLSDGGADTRAARRPVEGRSRVARLLVNLSQRFDPSEQFELRVLNHRPGLVAHRDGVPTFAMVVEVDDRLVRRIHGINNPAKLTFVDRPARLR